jgi:uncharacterized protein DUF6882
MKNWDDKQADFLRFLQMHGAEEAPYRVDLEQRKIYWVDQHGLSLVVADCKVLLSYALSNNSVMMAWANRSLAPGSAVDQVADLEDVYSDCDPEQVWDLTLHVATQAGAEAVYRTPSPQSWVMLGIWDLRSGGAEQFTSGSPKGHVMQVVQSLLSHPDFQERQVLLDNYAESFLQMASHPYKHTEYDPVLKDTARKFRNLLVFEDEEKQNQGLLEIQKTWELHQ